MGIPKFFRWISERYPMCSQLITENRIPEFDNLYLDMNGIVHNCSHNNNDNAHYRISEEEIWIGIFNYVDHLFSKIKPKKLFFLAIDGVAPRAKMNQQRSRRFRTAKDAENTRQRALSKGEVLPEEPPFDSNCITPGTEFMAKLTTQLRYFITKKVSEDVNWQGVEIVLSGPEVPGEGEHKIMEYIRLAKAQPDYNPNTRHCLYGLDADLIMLGLVSHDPHFALLREEVTFGKAGKKKKTSLDTQNFYLMHLSLLREYLELEFSSLKETLPFKYDLERIIDDFILLALFVGNDFLPHLPSLHIHDGALGLMFNIYKRVLPTEDGYLQDGGIVHLGRLQRVLDELGQVVEKESYEHDLANGLYLAGKREDGMDQKELLASLEKKKKGGVLITETQKKIFRQIKEFIMTHSPAKPGALHFPPELKARDRAFIERVAEDFNLHFATEYSNEDDSKHVYIDFYENEEGEEDVSEEDDETDEEAIAARDRVLQKYENAQVIPDQLTEEEFNQQEQEKYEEGLREWKRDYYREKMNIDIDNEEQMEALRKAYVTGIQWVLRYYYNGVASWGWFYPYHYAPKITDLIGIDKYQDQQFELGKPFRPYEQLMGVLPTLSKKLLPKAYRELMTDPSSPILDFYPNDFELDMNGKRQEWEAVVKIPFIDEKRLLEAMKRYEHRLTKEEQKRAEFGESFRFVHDDSLADANNGQGTVYPSPLPGVFPDIHHCLARQETFHLPTLDGGLTFKKHLLDGVKLGKEALSGFPSLHTIPHHGELKFHNVNVFQMESKNETMVVVLKNRFQDTNIEDIAKLLLYKRVYVFYPYLQEAVVIGVSNEASKYYVKVVKNQKQIREHFMDDDEKQDWRKRVGRVEYLSNKRFGLDIGKTDIAVHVCTLRGMKKTPDGAYVKEYVNPAQEELIPIQTVVVKVANPDPRYIEKPPPPVQEEFPVGSHVFFLGNMYYGSLATVVGHKKKNLVDIALIVPQNMQDAVEPSFGRFIAKKQIETVEYMPSYALASALNIDPLVLSKLTSSLTVMGKGMQRVNLGLNLKFEHKQLKVMGYTRKNKLGQWEFSKKAVELICDYIKAFPKFVELLHSPRGSDMLQVEDMAWTDNGQKEILQMRHWLKERNIDELARTPLEAEELEEPFVKMVEDMATQYTEKYDNLNFKKVILQHCPRSILLKPADAESKLHAQTFKLGDRVIYALEAGLVPFAAKGTVVGVQQKVVDVVFDTSFMGGKDLDGRCSNFRGISLPYSSVINLSYPAFTQQPPTQQVGHAHNNNGRYHNANSHGNGPRGHNNHHHPRYHK